MRSHRLVTLLSNSEADGRRAGHDRRGDGSKGRLLRARISLFALLFSINAAILVLAGVVLLLSPATVSEPVLLGEAVVLAAGVSAMLIADAFLLRRALTPLEELTELTHRVDLLRPGKRLALRGDYREVRELAQAFNAMLERLETERRQSTRRTLWVQEDERLRVARELHDEVGQALTALLLQHEALAQRERVDHSMLLEMRESVRTALEDVRRIAGDLRPVPLDDFGLLGALEHMSDRAVSQAGVSLSLRLTSGLPPLSRDVETAVYRIAQEAVTNALRHARAGRVRLDLAIVDEDQSLRLLVADDGRGLNGEPEGHGIRGMRERTVLIGGDLSIERTAGGGTAVTLKVPINPESEGATAS